MAAMNHLTLQTMRCLLILGTLVLSPPVLAALPLAPPPTAPTAPPAPPTERVTLATKTFELKVAADARSRATGLMGVETIEDATGMLFVFPRASVLSFWMANCLVDMDLIFIDRLGRIVALHEMKTEPPRRPEEPEWAYHARLRRYLSGQPAQFAIELKAGSIRDLKLEIGAATGLDVERLRSLAKTVKPERAAE